MILSKLYEDVHVTNTATFLFSEMILHDFTNNGWYRRKAAREQITWCKTTKGGRRSC